jgi:hypothetical protein
MLNIVGAATIRTKIYEFDLGSDATPADTAARFSWQRTTANFGTPAAVTPRALDPGDPASLSLYSSPGGTAPTITAASDLYQVAMNGRANFRWVAAPDSEFVIPATAANGLCLTSVTAAVAAQQYIATVLWVE